MTIINSLDYQGFQKLQKLCVKFKTNTNPWFESSYPVFVKHPISKIDDIIPLIAYAYSWMPTIPTVKFESLQNDMCLLDELKSLQNGTVCNLNSILGKMIPAINNSIVGTSKVLHFIAPEKIAIIDSRVTRAWNKHIKSDEILFSNTFSKLNIESNIKSYVQYNKRMNEWRDNINIEDKDITLRNLEFILYRLGETDDNKKQEKKKF